MPHLLEESRSWLKAVLTTRASLSDLKAAAQELALAGFSVFPIKAGDKRPPLVRRGFYAATTDAATIERWWSLFPDANIGLRTGAGLAVVDVDPRNGGTVPNLPDTLKVRTPAGGWHFYYSVDVPVRCSSGKVAPGVDIKADGGYVLAPPSRRADGEYVWMGGTLAVADPSLLDPQRRAESEPPIGGSARPLNWTPWEPRETVREGERHDELTSWAGYLRAQAMEYEEILEVLEEVNETFQPPLEDQRELTGIARWAARRPL